MDFKSIYRKNKPVLSALAFVFVIALIFWLVSSPRVVGVSASQRQFPIFSLRLARSTQNMIRPHIRKLSETDRANVFWNVYSW